MDKNSGLISWFTRNPVAANLAMFLIFFGGALSLGNLSKEMFPRAEMPVINVNVYYPGAAPIEVEKGVILPVEATLDGLKGIKRIYSNAYRDRAQFGLALEDDADVNELITQVENRLNSITNFPSDIEKPEVTQMDQRAWAMGVVVYGDMSEVEKKTVGEEIKSDLLALSSVKDVQLWGAGRYEISIEVSEDRLRELDLTLDEVANAVRSSSMDLPAGLIKGDAGNILLRTEGKAYTGSEFENIVLRSKVDGTELKLSEVANVRDAFSDDPWNTRFDRKPNITLGVFSLEGQNVLDISDDIHEYVTQKQETLPEGLSIVTWNDSSFYLKGRIKMMSENLLLGSLLVTLVLGLFLNLRVAFWVAVGIPVSFAGAFWLMPFGDVTVNVLSLFAFMMCLGIVVDDAIVIGESVFSAAQEEFEAANPSKNSGSNDHRASVEAVISGAKRVATPATIGVLTTMAAFTPLIFIGGSFAAITSAIGIVVVLCLAFSLVESKLILPAHLVGLKFTAKKNPVSARIHVLQLKISKKLKYFIEDVYRPLLIKSLRNRFVTLAGFLSLLILVFGMINGGIARFEFFPQVPGDNLSAELTMQDGAPSDRLMESISVAEDAIFRIDENFKRDNPNSDGLVKHVGFFISNDVSASFRVELVKAENRTISATEIAELWRDEVGLLPNVKTQKYSVDGGPGGGGDIALMLSGQNTRELSLAGIDLQEYLTQFDGIYDVFNSEGSGSKEILIKLKPYASQIGVRLSDVARQVRQAFYGEEAQRIQRDSDTLRVMVRYPKEDRQSLSTLENMYIRTVTGQSIPIREVASISLGTGPASINREERKRILTVQAYLDPDKVQSGKVIADIQKNFVPVLTERYPSVEFGLGGKSEETNEYFDNMLVGFLIAMIMIYGLLAVPLRSYLQPIVIMSVIPFGVIGAVIGHVIFDFTLNMLSVFGIVALAGVVVNDSLILVEFTNRGRSEGMSLESAIVNAGQKRFRAILLTTVTTFVGLFPILFNTSVQAQFVIPMALSLSFGIVFASTITLILIPCLYLVVETNHRFVSSILVALLLISILYVAVFAGIIGIGVANVVTGLLLIISLIISILKVFGKYPEKQLAFSESSS